MGCSCRDKKKTDLTYIESMAIKSAIINEEDYQIYTYSTSIYKVVYDFEPISESRTTVVKYIRYKDYKK